jgi:deoxyribodipyrimidine photolyase
MDKLAYEESLKVYRDLKAVTDTANEDGYKEAESLLTSQLEEERRQKDTLIKTLSKTMSIAEGKLARCSRRFYKVYSCRVRILDSQAYCLQSIPALPHR